MAGPSTWAAGRSIRQSASIATGSGSAPADSHFLMRRQIVARLWQSLIVVFIVTTISFFVIRVSPGDPFGYGAQSITPAIRSHWREQFGYNRPVLEQYVRYVASIGHGQLGYSFTRHETVLEALKTTLPRTLLLAGLAFALSFAIGIVVGVVQAAQRGSWFDRIS